MNRPFAWLLAGLVIAAVPVRGNESAAVRLSIVNVGGVEAGLFDRVVAHVREHLETEPEVVPPVSSTGAADLKGEAEALIPLVTEQRLVVIGLALPEADIEQHGLVDPAARVGVVNARALRPADGDGERYARRLEKETVRAIGLLVGLKPVPIPYSALYPYQDEQMLDAKARTLDPPSLMEFKRIARDKKLQGYTD